MYFNLDLFSGVIKPLEPTSKHVRVGFISVMSETIQAYLSSFTLWFLLILLSWPAVNSQISTVFLCVSWMTRSGFSSVTARAGSSVPPVVLRYPSISA